MFISAVAKPQVCSITIVLIHCYCKKITRTLQPKHQGSFLSKIGIISMSIMPCTVIKNSQCPHTKRPTFQGSLTRVGATFSKPNHYPVNVYIYSNSSSLLIVELCNSRTASDEEVHP